MERVESMKADELYDTFLEAALNQIERVIVSDYENLINNSSTPEKQVIIGHYNTFLKGRAERKANLKIRFIWVLPEIRKALAQGLSAEEISCMLQIQPELYKLLLYDTPEKMKSYREYIAQGRERA